MTAREFVARQQAADTRNALESQIAADLYGTSTVQANWKTDNINSGSLLISDSTTNLAWNTVATLDAVNLTINPIWSLTYATISDPELYVRPGRVISLGGSIEQTVSPLQGDWTRAFNPTCMICKGTTWVVPPPFCASTQGPNWLRLPAKPAAAPKSLS
jgi:hypothetical protein